MREFTKPAKSRFSLINGGKDIKFYVQSNDPNEMGEDEEVVIPSVAAELTYNFKLYHVDRSDLKRINWLTFSSYPDDLEMVIETIRHNVNFSRAPGSQVTIACCVTLGLPRLHASRSIKHLSEICHEFKKRRKTGSLIEKFINKYLEMEVPIPVDTGTKIKVAVQQEIKNQISTISDETGLTQSSVGILAMYASLVQQEYTPQPFKEEWQDRLEKSLELIECKVRGAKSIMEMLPNV